MNKRFAFIDNFQLQRKDIGLFLTLLLPVIFFQTLLSFLNSWLDTGADAYSHGWLLSLIALGILIHTYYTHSESIQLNIHFSSLFIIIPCLFIWLLATVSSTEIIAQLALIALMAILLCYFYGYRSMFYFYPAFALLLCVTSIWNVLGIPLRMIAAFTCSHILNLIGVSNIRDGFYIEISSGLFLVDTGCSGVGQFVIALAIAFIYSWYTKLNIKYTAIAVILAACIAVISNIIRICIIIIFGELTNMQHYFVTVEHISLGWVVFAVLIYIYFILADKILLNGNITVKEYSSSVNGKNNKIFLGSLIPIILCLATASYATHFLHKQANSSIDLNIYSEFDILDEIPVWQPSALGASHISNDVIDYQDSKINLHIFFYEQQKQGYEAINSEHKIADESWHVTKVQQNTHINHNIYTLINAENEKYIALQSYWVDGSFYRSSLKGKVLNAWNTLKNNPHAAFIVISSKYKNKNALEYFMQFQVHKVHKILNQHSQQLRQATK